MDLDGSDAVIIDCVIRNNTAMYGGGISGFEANSPNIRNSQIVNNTSSGMGGGLYFQSCSGVVLKNCLLGKNKANQAVGGAM